MREVFQRLKQAILEKQDTMLLTIGTSSGSTPRSQGARMLVSAEGRIAGTVGGGAVEFQAEQVAKKLVLEKENAQRQFILAPNNIADLGMVCGGNVTIFFHYLSWETPFLKELCESIETHFQNNQQGWLVTELDQNNLGKVSFYSETGELIGPTSWEGELSLLPKGIHCEQKEDIIFLTEAILQVGKVYIFGSGHVARALVPILNYLSFYCVVVDDRPEFLTAQAFSQAEELRVIPLENLAAFIEITADDYGIVITRGHNFDFIVAKQLLETPAKYIGVMGSKHKIASQVRRLKEVGYTMTEIERIFMPIGLDIAAETPEELAISIAGELIQQRYQ